MKAHVKILKKQSNFCPHPPSPENWGPKVADFQFFMAGAFSIAFSAINSIATHYETICEDSKKAVKFSPSPAPKLTGLGPPD